MRTLHPSLAWVVTLVLLAGMVGTALAQETETAAFDESSQVTGQIHRYVTWRAWDVSWDEERAVETRSIYVENPIEMDDPRLTGLLRRAWNVKTFGGRRERGTGEVLAEKTELITDDGTWVGTMRGYVTSDPRRHYWHYQLTGTGAYEGHTALLWTQGPGGGPHDVEGFVFPGALPDYPAELPAE